MRVRASMEKELRAATIRAFEESAFLMPVLGAELPDDRAAPDEVVRVPFEGPLTGEFVLEVYGGVAAVLAANMLGTNEAPTRLTQLDAVCEMANVVCGNVLPRLSGSPRAFRIGAPELLCEWEVMGLARCPASAQTFVGFEEGGVRVKLYLNEQADGAQGRS